MEAKKHNLGAAIATALIALPILYVLSIGPVFFVAWRLPESIRGEVVTALDHFYFPVRWLQADTPLSTPLVWYLKLWIGP